MISPQRSPTGPITRVIVYPECDRVSFVSEGTNQLGPRLFGVIHQSRGHLWDSLLLVPVVVLGKQGLRVAVIDDLRNGFRFTNHCTIFFASNIFPSPIFWEPWSPVR